MSSKINFTDINQTINAFVDGNRAKHGSHAYAAGFLKIQLSMALLDMPKRKQMEILSVLQRYTPELQSQTF